MNIAIIGGGINGLCTAWLLQQSGHQTTLFERDQLMSATSSKSSKLLHGGLRYLENGEFRLVQEALKERQFWLEQAPELTNTLRIYLPIYKNSSRATWKVRIGLWLYDLLAGKKNLGKHKKEKLARFMQQHPQLKTDKLSAVFSYSDGQMDDKALGLWVAEQIKTLGGIIHENTAVRRISSKGDIYLDQKDNHQHFDKIINVSGPWATQLLNDSQLSTDTHLDLIRGTHLLIKHKVDAAYILEVPNTQRIFFVLPYQQHTLIGTTEIRQTLNEPIQASQEEIEYLMSAYNHYFISSIDHSDIVRSFAGVRPLLKSHANPSKSTREYLIEKKGKVLSVFGGKWTTARALAQQVVKQVQ